eukprot:1138040-Pelagomonas_calceolata.AAC.4
MHATRSISRLSLGTGWKIRTCPRSFHPPIPDHKRVNTWKQAKRPVTLNNKSPGPDGIVNKIPRMLPHEIQECNHKLFIIMWATRLTPVSWKARDTILIDKNKGEETQISSYRPIGLSNTLNKLWTRMVTITLYEYAKAHSLLSSTQAGFQNQKVTIHQLQNVIMGLEDA